MAVNETITPIWPLPWGDCWDERAMTSSAKPDRLIWNLACSSNGQFLVSSHDQDSIRLWDVRPWLTPTDHAHPATALERLPI